MVSQERLSKLILLTKMVKRNEKGEIIHILVGNEMMAKEDAHKVMYGNVDPVQVEDYLLKVYGRVNAIDAMSVIADILNEKETILDLKKKMLGYKNV